MALHDIDPPTPTPSEALVRVAAISLNRGEVRRSTTAAAGWQPGWDLAGIVETPAADGSSPPAGTRVVGFVRSGAWGELVAVPTNAIAPLPDSVSFAQAATLPVAGLTAYHALKQGGLLLGLSVLITGASGGMGNFAIQLARLSGAKVIAHIRKPDHEAFNAQRFYGTSSGASLYALILFHKLKRESATVGLQRLLNLVASGQLRPQIAIEAPWTQVADLAQQLLDRRFLGKAVLHVF